MAPIQFDNVFKAVFTKNTPASQGALSKLISAPIGQAISVTAISANEPPIDNLRDRQIRFDIACKAENGEPVNVEMSLNPDPFETVHASRIAWTVSRREALHRAGYPGSRQDL
jgi:hypothetical protein